MFVIITSFYFIFRNGFQVVPHVFSDRQAPCQSKKVTFLQQKMSGDLSTFQRLRPSPEGFYPGVCCTKEEVKMSERPENLSEVPGRAVQSGDNISATKFRHNPW
jgi:hypothetical protein